MIIFLQDLFTLQRDANWNHRWDTSDTLNWKTKLTTTRGILQAMLMTKRAPGSIDPLKVTVPGLQSCNMAMLAGGGREQVVAGFTACLHRISRYSEVGVCCSNCLYRQ